MTAEKYQLVMNTIHTTTTPERMVRIILRLNELEQSGECTPYEFAAFMHARNRVERERGRGFTLDVYKLYAAKKAIAASFAS